MLGLKAKLNVRIETMMLNIPPDSSQVIDNSGAILAELINVYKVRRNPAKSVGFATVGE